MADPDIEQPRGTLRRALASIRFRIIAGYFLLVLTALVITVLITRQVQLSRADREIEQEQAEEIDRLRTTATAGRSSTGEPWTIHTLFYEYLSKHVPSDDEGFYTLVDGTPHYYSRGSPPLFEDPQFAAAWGDVTEPTRRQTASDVEGIGDVWSLAVPVQVDDEVAGVFVVASFPDDDYGEVHQLVWVITVAGIVVLVVTTVAAWLIAERILRPVRQLSTTARSITESDLSARIPVEGEDELAELGQTFNDMLDRLEKGFTSQRRFLDDVAHELRTPITIARGHLEFMGDDPVERTETVAIVTDELDRMSRYVSDLLTLAKAEQPDFLHPEPVDIGELIVEIHQRAQALGNRVWTIDHAPPPGVFAAAADPDRLRQALMNLIANAVQHTRAGDEIGLGARAADGTIRLSVRDTGPGIDPAVVSSLFDRWSRGARSREQHPEGAGIGLSIVAAIARAHGGDVEVSSDRRGATFTIVVPAHDAAREFEPPSDLPAPPLAGPPTAPPAPHLTITDVP
jgi:signal transduction histidine kinase